jgi:glycosyltransferase involved in cell wall biosynthesis
MLLRLAEGLQSRGIDNVVVSLSSREPLAEAFEARGIRVYSLDMSTILRGLVALRTLKNLIKELAPDVVQGWMYHANLVAILIRPFARRSVPVLWNIRRGTDDVRERKFLTRAVIRANAWLSSRAERIVYCTRESRDQHEALGFSHRNGVVIGNGFDVERFTRSQEIRRVIRERYGVADTDILIGNIGRDDSAKGRAYLIEAFAEVMKRVPHARLMLVGRGMSETNPDLRRLLVSSGVAPRVILVGEYSPISELYSAMDILCSSSVTEGFPNVIGEGMCCEVPCVASDVGNVRTLLDGIGIVVPPRSAPRLAQALIALCEEDRAAWRDRGARARARIAELYSLSVVVGTYASLYRQVALGEAKPQDLSPVEIAETSELKRPFAG